MPCAHRGASTFAAVLCALAALAPAPAWAVPHLYVTSPTQNAIAVVDTAVDAMVDVIPLAIGSGDVEASPDGTTALVLDRDAKRLNSVDLATGRLRRQYALGNSPVDVVLSREGDRAFVLGYPVIAVDLRDGAVSTLLDAARLRDLAVPAGAHRVYVALDFGVGVAAIDTRDGSIVLGAPDFQAVSVAVTSDEQFVYLVGTREEAPQAVRLLILSGVTLEPVAEIALQPGERVFDLLLSADDTRLYALTGSLAGFHIIAVDTATRQTVLLSTRDDVGPMRLSPDGGQLYFFRYRDRTIQVIDAHSGADRGSFVADAPFAAFAVAPDGSTLHVALRNGLRTFAADDFATLATAPSVSEPLGIVASADGSTVYVAGVGSHTVGIVDTASRQLIDTIEFARGVREVLLSPDGARLYVRGGDQIEVVDTVRRTILASIGVGSSRDGRLGMALSQDGQRLLAVNWNLHSVSVIDTAADEVAEVFEVRENPSGVAVSADGRIAVVANYGPQHLQMIDLTASPPRAVGSTVLRSGYALDPCAVVIRHDGQRAFALDKYATEIYAAAVPGGRLLARTRLPLSMAAESCGLAFAADERQLYVANSGNHLLSVVDAADLHVRRHIPVLLNPARIALACPGGCPPPPPPPTTCQGDCGEDGAVTVSDLVQAVAIATGGAAVSACPAADGDGDAEVSIAELVAGVGNALGGCPGAS